MQIGERQKRRKVSQIREYVSSTLEPSLATYGLVSTELTAVTTNGASVTISLSDCVPRGPPTEPTGTEDVTAKTLYLLDRYGVSDEFYHELTQV